MDLDGAKREREDAKEGIGFHSVRFLGSGLHFLVAYRYNTTFTILSTTNSVRQNLFVPLARDENNKGRDAEKEREEGE